MGVVRDVLLSAAAGMMLFLFASFAFAQGGDLGATIRASVLSDPRSSEMSEREINSMVAALAAEASKQGIRSEDIAWRPQEFSLEEVGDESEACGYAVFLCSLNEAFGFSGSSIIIPLLLGVCSVLLLFILGSILLHIHGHHPVRGPISPAP